MGFEESLFEIRWKIIDIRIDLMDEYHVPGEQSDNLVQRSVLSSNRQLLFVHRVSSVR